jgi:hypothetical protein
LGGAGSFIALLFKVYYRCGRIGAAFTSHSSAIGKSSANPPVRDRKKPKKDGRVTTMRALTGERVFVLGRMAQKRL